MQRFKEGWELATAIIRWAALVIGGICLLFVCVTAGWFPEDMTLGEGVALYFISVGFVIAYAAYWLGVTSVGLLLARWPMEFAFRFGKKAPSHAAGYALSNFKLMWSLPVWGIAAITVTFVATRSLRIGWYGVVMYVCVLGLQGFIGGMLLAMHRGIRLNESGLRLADRLPLSAENATDFRRFTYLFLGMWIVTPVLIGLANDSLMNSAFRLAQLRKENAVVHVAEPWDQRLIAAGLKPRESFLGTEYARFEKVTVRMRSIGSRVVLEVPSGQGEGRFVNIPKQHVEIE